MTFYRKYRPQKIDELDLETVRVQLSNVLRSNSIPHAFLFSGARGLGKTSAARIVAKSITCETRLASKHPEQDIEPCNICDACISITKGMAPDVIEIDGASNRGIDDVRSLRESIVSSPLRLTKKIFVIDEVHMLTKEAFNALLKTLEEPPEHVIFIMATTEPHKLPETIISRAFHIQFQKATVMELKRSLQRVIIGEKLTVSDEALGKIIQKADGAFRDSAKILEQLSFVSPTIDEGVFAAVFPEANTAQFIEYLLRRDGQAAFEWIANQAALGADWENIIRTILNQLKQDLLAFYGIGTKKNNLVNENDLKALITLCMQAGSQLKNSLIATLPLEMVVATWCDPNTVDQIKTIVKQEEQPKIANSKETKQTEPMIVRESKEKPVVIPEKKKDSKLVEKTITQSLSITLEDIQHKWEQLLANIRLANHSVEALLRSAQPQEVTGGTVYIKVYYEFHKGKLASDKCLQIVESAFETVFGVKPKIQYVLGQKQEKQKLDEQKDAYLAKIAEEIFS